MGEFTSKMIDYMNDVKDFNYHNGIKIVKISNGYAECRVELSPESNNSQGIAHGGLIFALADVAAGYAADDDDRECVTSNSNINFLRPAMGSYLKAVAKPIKAGRKMSVVECSVTDERGKLIAIATFTYCFIDNLYQSPAQE